MTTIPSEVKSDNVTVAIKQEPGSKVVLDISVTPKATDAAYSKAVKNVNKEISLPGFRKGKAPENFVIEKYGKQVETEWRSIVVQTGVQEAFKLLPNLYPYKKEGIRCSAIKQMARDTGALFTVEYEAAPAVPKIDLNSITLGHVDRRPVAQKDIDQIVEDLRYRLAKWEDVPDRAVQENDFVDLDIDKLDDPVEEVCRGSRFGVNDMSPWMKKIVVGSHIGDSIEGVSEPDERRAESSQEPFQPTHCRITVKAIKKATLPDLDDSLAQKVGLKTWPELEERIVADLNRNADREMREQLHRQVDHLLLENYRFDMPLSLLEDEKQQRIDDATHWMHEVKATEEMIEQRKENLEKTLPEQVEKSCRLFFLLISIANAHNIQVTRDEIAQELSRQILQGQRLPSDRNSEQIQNRLGRQILLQKTRDYIIDHVKRA